ncbi:MAG: MBL fold metallo-hydrolase [Myxococcales bacterium]|nr:MBL fold metallo-hydrolase [Myxococcales bacterium]
MALDGLQIIQIEVGLLQNFNELIADPATGECAVVDPAYEVDRLLKLARDRGWTIRTVLVTHTHHDHIDGVAELCAATSAVVRVGAREADAVRAAAPGVEVRPVSDGERVPIGGESIEALSTPGHTVDGTSYFTGGAIITGDTLFVGGVGRTDFPGGDASTLWRSLQKIAALPEETRVYPGHDYGTTPTSTVGWERTTNPYLRCATEEAFVALRTGKRSPRPTRGPR